MKLFKIKFDGASGTGLFFVTEADSAKDARNKFYDNMMSTDRMKDAPKGTNKKFIGTVRSRVGKDAKYWIIRPK